MKSVNEKFFVGLTLGLLLGGGVSFATVFAIGGYQRSVFIDDSLGNGEFANCSQPQSVIYCEDDVNLAQKLEDKAYNSATNLMLNTLPFSMIPCVIGVFCGMSVGAGHCDRKSSNKKASNYDPRLMPPLSKSDPNETLCLTDEPLDSVVVGSNRTL